MASRDRKDGSTRRVAPAVVLGGALVGALASLTALSLVLLRGALDRAGRPDGILSNLVDGSLGGLLIAACLTAALVAFLVIAAAAAMGPRNERPAHDPSVVRSTRELAGPRMGTRGSQNPPRDEPWARLVGECVGIVDELDVHMNALDAPRREMAEHVMMRLEEVLARSGVEVISDEAVFDRSRHKPDAAGGSAAPGAPIAETLSPGFAVGPRVLRRARVRVPQRSFEGTE